MGDLIGNLLQSPIRVWPIGETFVESFGSAFSFTQFIAHELLYLYTTSKSTISNLRIFDRLFQSHPKPYRLLTLLAFCPRKLFAAVLKRWHL